MFAIAALVISAFVLGEDLVDEPPTDMPSLAMRRAPSVTTENCILSKTRGPDRRPLLSNGSHLLYQLNGGGGDIFIPTDSQFIVSCAPVSNLLTTYHTNKVQVRCLASGQFAINGQPAVYKDFGCKTGLKENVAEHGTCHGQNANITIEFTDQQKRFPLINLCHDRTSMNTLVTQHKVYGGSLGVAEISNNRPSFKEGQYFQSVSANSVYSQQGQKNMIKELLDSTKLSNKYIDPSQSFYFARGHMAPDGDFVTAAEQNATYYYVNVFPQWQSINNGNWKALEIGIRKLAGSRNSTLTVYTGAQGILRLKDEEEVPVEIFLGQSPNSERLVIPVPKLTWKIVHDPKRRLAVVVVMLNNPHDQPVAAEDIICKNICGQIKWVTWDVTNIRKGFTYCCDVKEFSSVVNFAPKFPSTVRTLRS